MAGRKASTITQVRLQSKEARTRLLDMVKSYCVSPSARKAKAIAGQLENVEVSENLLREEVQNHEALLFGGVSDVNGQEIEEEEDTSANEESEEEEEEDDTPVPTTTPKPVAPTPKPGGMVTAKNKNK